MDIGKFCILTYGCQMNLHDSEKIAGILSKMGYTDGGEDLDQAGIIVLNTCCIRETAEHKIVGHIGELKHLKEKKPNLIIVVCGCMTQQDGVAEGLNARYPFIDIILGTHNLDKLSEKVKLAKKKKGSLIEISNEAQINESVPTTRTSMPNAWVNIIYGCNNFCTYCIVPYVRGRERSRTMQSIFSEVKSLVEEGYKEITLLGQNVNSYGNDLSDGSSFAKLLKQLCQIDGKFKLSFMTSHPKDFTDEVIEIIAQNEKISRHIHLPVQAGSTSVLERMNRKYTREDYIKIVEKIKAAIPNVGITTDIMVGFNGEREEDFKDTLDIVSTCQFSNAFCFVYSRRKGTAGYLMGDCVDAQTKKDRIRRLISLQKDITNQQNAKLIGKVLEVLIEDRNEKYANTVKGRSTCGRLVNIKGDEKLVGKFIQAKITKTKSSTLWGQILEE